MTGKAKCISFIDVFLCLIISLAVTAAPSYMKTGECEHDIRYFCSTFIMMIILLVITWLIRRRLIRKRTYTYDENNSVFLRSIKRILNSKRGVLQTGLIIFLCWLPVLVVLYPGTLINDTWSQLNQFIRLVSEGRPLDDAQPVFDTLIMGAIIVPLSQATGQWHLFIFLYVIIQSFFTCLAFAYVIHYIYKNLHLDLKLTLLFLAVYAFLPIYPASAQTIAKDSLSAWIFVLFMVNYLEIIRTSGSVKKSVLIRFFFESILVCLTKKTCVIIVIPSILGLVLFIKPFRKSLFLSFLCILLLNAVAFPFLKKAAGIKPGGLQEPLSMPFQMSARYVKFHGDDVTEEEYNILDKVLKMEDLAKRYNPTSADPVKGYKQIAEDHDYYAYLKVWLKQGIRHPDTYLEAANAMICGWFSWYKNDPLMNMDWHSRLNPKYIPEWVSERTFNDSAATDYQGFFDDLYNNPFLKVLLSFGLYASLIPAFTIGTVLRRWGKKKTRYWLVLIPLLLAVFICWGSPVSCHLEGKRYLYPLTYTAPLFLSWCVYIYNDNSSEQLVKRSASSSVL